MAYVMALPHFVFIGGGCEELPRHMHDCLYQVYYDLGLEFGYIENPLKELN